MKEYLGDGIYVDWDEYISDCLVLTTSDGIQNTNTIFLEDYVLIALIDYLSKTRRKGESSQSPSPGH
jgi:hypothetical protein